MNPPRQVQQPPLMSDGRLHSVSELSCILPFLLAQHTTYKHTRDQSRCTFGEGWGLPVWSWGGGTTRWPRWPSWSSSAARSWPCCICCCSRKHLRSEGHTGGGAKLSSQKKLRDLLLCSYLPWWSPGKSSPRSQSSPSWTSWPMCCWCMFLRGRKKKAKEPWTRHHRIPITADSDLQEISGWEVWSWLRCEPSACRHADRRWGAFTSQMGGEVVMNTWWHHDCHVNICFHFDSAESPSWISDQVTFVSPGRSSLLTKQQSDPENWRSLLLPLFKTQKIKWKTTHCTSDSLQLLGNSSLYAE